MHFCWRVARPQRWPHTHVPANRTMQYQQFPQFGGMPGGGMQSMQGMQQRGMQGMQGFPGQQPMQGNPYGQQQQFGGYGATQMPGVQQTAPLTPKVQGIPQSQLSMTSPPGVGGFASQMVGTGPVVNQMNQTKIVTGTREQQLERRVQELESMLAMKDKTIQELQSELGKSNGQSGRNSSKARSPPKGFRKVSESKPVVRYSATDQDDPIDVRLEEFYNATGSAIQFRRINRGFYRFGDSIVELDIINHKLMSRTEDGWNRGKFGPIEKFLMYYENVEREKAGILAEC